MFHIGEKKQVIIKLNKTTDKEATNLSYEFEFYFSRATGNKSAIDFIQLTQGGEKYVCLGDN